MKFGLLVASLFAAAPLAAQVVTTAPAAPLTPVTPRVNLTAPRAWVDASPLLDAHSMSTLNYDIQHSYALENMATSLNNMSYSLSDLGSFSGLTSINWGNAGPVAWAQSDPADSLYRQARDQFNRGDYRKAADLFRSLPQKFATSAYVADAQYWQAFSLYRIGGTPELQQALAVLEARKVPDADRANGQRTTVTNAGTSGNLSGFEASRMATAMGNSLSRNNDAAGLAARIANVLSGRGMSNDAAVKRALAAGGNTCDADDQSVKAEALSALMQNDAETGRQMAVKILANKDECSVPLRRNAVMLVGNKHDDAATSTLIPVAKSDPSPSVRTAALDYLVRQQSDAAINAVIDISKMNDDKQVQRAAVRALAQSTNARARAEVRTVVENNALDESLRMSVIDGLSGDRMTTEDATWLRALYGRSTSTRVRERIVSALSRAGGDANNQWLMQMVRNEDEPLESRTWALERVGRTMDLATLNKMYDVSAQRPIRRAILDLLSERKEPEALDKIVEVAKTGTDIETRRQAINILSRSKDPRASKLLLQLVDH